MKIVNMQCPNCGARLTIESNMYVCNSCGTTIAIDYDESDVEYERAKNEVELEAKRQAHEKELLERQFELQQKAQIESEKRQIKRERQKAMSNSLKRLLSSVISLVFLFGIGFGIYKLYSYMMTRYGANGGYSGGADVYDTPTPAPNYDVTPEILKADLDDFIESGRKVQMNIDQCGVMNENGIVHFYDKTDAVFLDAYLVSDIPNVDEEESCRLVLVYEVTWHNDDYGDQICYDAVYFDGIRVNPNGGIISDYSGKIIWRSDAAWGWNMAYSFEDYGQCYLENVKALGGTVTEVVRNSSLSTETAATAETEAVETEEVDDDYEDYDEEDED